MCTRAGAPARSFTAATPTAPAAQAAPTTQASAQPTRPSGLMSDTGIQDMDDATMTALITRAMRAPIAQDGRDRTMAQRIADTLGITQNQPESVRQEALAQYRGGTGRNGTIYRTVNDGAKTARQIAHDLTDATDHGLNYGGGRAWGTGLYFAGNGPSDSRNAGAHESSLYGSSYRNPYTLEARIKPTARIARASDITGASGRAWVKAHTGALRKLGLTVTASGTLSSRGSGMSQNDMQTTVAMLMGYDGFDNGTFHTPYFTIWNRGALQVARGNKYDRARNGAL